MSSPVSPNASPPRLFDRARLARNRDRAAAEFENYDFLKARVSSDIAERLADTSHSFERAFDLGAHDGQLAKTLQDSGQVTTVEAGDLAKFGEAYGRFRGHELWGSTVGLIGLGAVGRIDGRILH